MKIVVCKGCLNKMMAVDKEGKPACVVCHGFPDRESQLIFLKLQLVNPVGRSIRLMKTCPF